jgi:DNA-binding transcriptional LysR family regulator
MEIRQLRYFILAAKHLNFTAAAQESFIVQSAMSQQIALLEKELQVRLFERHSRSLTLTPAGEVLYSEARRILQQIDASVALVKNVSNGYLKTLHIGCHGALIRKQFPEILNRFHQEVPHVKVSLMHDVAENLMKRLKEGKVDCIICIYAPDIRQKNWLDYRVFRNDRVMLMLSRNHAYAQYSTIRMNALPKDPVVLLKGGNKKDRLLDWEKMGRAINDHCYADDHDSIETLVAAGYAISFCLKSACRPHPLLSYVEIEDHPEEKICLCWNNKADTDLVQNQLLPLLLMEPAK